ncbi:SinI family restriction endonuclease [Bacillus megaterium]|nr:SinI family restriction endonuclease [Priestia megaterium]
MNTLIDWAVEFEQIPDQKPSAAIKALSEEDQILPLLQKWLKNYVKSLTSPVSLRHAKPLSEKDTVEDPALAHMLSTHYKEINKVVMNPPIVKQNLESHQLLMAIENIQGHLLEDYIASVICQPLYGFIWCDGQTIKAADFCKRIVVDNTPELKLIQIKNKYNTENSSSSKIRKDTPIEIWHRLGKKKDSTGKNIPVYRWDELNQTVQEITQHNPKLNEQAYFDFLEGVIKRNPKIFYNG